MARSIVMRTLGSIVLVRESAAPPTHAEWQEGLDMLREQRPNLANLKMLVMTDGGGPNAAQRTGLSRVLEGRPVRVAVVSDSIKVRFVVSTLAFVNSEIRAFSRAEIGQAYDHLGIEPDEQPLVETTLAEMGRQMD